MLVMQFLVCALRTLCLHPVLASAMALLITTAAAPAWAQQAGVPAGHNMADMQPVLPPEQLPAPIRMTGIGNTHIAITAGPEAQAWFDQGLNLMHDFWDYESVKAFEQSVRVDPNCAMCWWGLAQAEGIASQPTTGLWKTGVGKSCPAEGPCQGCGKAIH